MKGKRRSKKKKSLRSREAGLVVDVTEFLYLDRGKNCLIPGKSCTNFSISFKHRRHFARVKFTIFNFIFKTCFLITFC